MRINNPLLEDSYTERPKVFPIRSLKTAFGLYQTVSEPNSFEQFFWRLAYIISRIMYIFAFCVVSDLFIVLVWFKINSYELNWV